MAAKKQISIEVLSQLINEGQSLSQVANTLEVSTTTVHFHCKRLGLKTQTGTRQDLDWSLIQQVYDSEQLSIKELAQRFNVAQMTIVRHSKRGLFRPRSKREACIVGRRKRTNNGYVVSDDTKSKISKRRIEYLNAHPDKVPYILNHSSKISYPESYFRGIFEFDAGVAFEYRVGRYRLDIAFPDQLINIEIDGEQHYVDARVIQSDTKRTQYLTELGWKCIRIRWATYCKLSKQDKEKFIQGIRIQSNPIRRTISIMDV